MRKRFLSFFMGVVLCLLCMSPAFVFAEDVVLSNEELSSSMYDELISYYGLTGDTGEDIVYYIYGRKNGGTGNPRSSLWVGAISYHCSYDLQSGSYSFSKGTFAIQLLDSYVGRSELGSAYWYEASSSQLAFISGFTDNIRISEIYPNNNWTQTKSVTFEEFGSSLVPSPSEPTSSDGPPFQLPDDWINGGNTLETRQPSTFENLDSDSALEEFENLTDVEFETSFLDAVSFYWAVVIGVIDSMGIWVYVYVSMTILLIAFLLGRNV